MARRPLVLTALAVFVVAVAAHARGLGNGFVYDDHRFVELNKALSPVTPLEYFTDAGTASAGTGTEGGGGGITADIYRPLRTLDYAIDRAVFSTEPAPYHAENVLLHGLNAALVLLVLLPLLGGMLIPAAAGALLFAVHPATVETVAWISSRGDLWAVLAMLSALLVTAKPGTGRTAALAALTAVGCLMKESAVVLPALVLLRDLALPREGAPSRRETALRVALCAGVVALYFVARLAVVPELKQVDHPAGSALASARGMMAALTWYAASLVLPSGFPFDSHLAVPLSWTDPEAVLGISILLSVLLLGVYGLLRRRPVLAFAALGALACLVPVSNVLVPLKTFAAERFLYPLLPCLAAGVGWLIFACGRQARPAVLAVLGVALVIFAVITIHRTEKWSDDVSLWTAVMRDRPTNPQAYEGLGREHLRAGRMGLAVPAYRTYLGFNPTDGKAWAALGDGFGDEARSLRLIRHTEGQTTDIARKRHEAQVLAIDAWRRALSAWAEVGDRAGRGSDAWRRAILDRISAAAWEMGDLLAAKDANDALLLMDHVDPRDVRAVLEKGDYRWRRRRLLLASLAVTTPIGGLRGADYDLGVQSRNAMLVDVAVDPTKPDEEVRPRLVPLFEAMERERGKDWGLVTAHADLLEGMGDARGALELLEALRTRFPDEAEIHALIRELKARMEAHR